MTRRITVVGVGNAWRHDDGAGLEVARRAAGRLAPDVRVYELDGEPARVVEAWDGASLAVLVDAVRTGAPPGTLHEMEMTDTSVPMPATSGSSHALGPAEAYRLGQTLGRVPDRLVLLGIEIADVTPGVGLSSVVDAAIARAVDAIAAIVEGERAVRST